ncbi:hypothetical protein [Spirillospora sp. CA-294931]|uniref:hypothetical protein n=1 Tax=Spirillospora sp. CA-294931 TaxID=3240042 RepID=UPI003D8F30DA
MRATNLLDEIEPLPFGERCRRLADLRDSPHLDGLLDDLGRGGYYERSTALFLAATARHREHVVRAMRDPDAELAARAMGLAARFGVEAVVFAAVVAEAPSAVRSAAYAGLRRWRRTDVAERLVGPVAERWGPGEAAALLPVCRERVVREWLPRVARLVPNWKSLGRAHPDVVLDHAESFLAELPEREVAIWLKRMWPGVAIAVSHDPTRVVGLLERYWAVAGLLAEPEGSIHRWARRWMDAALPAGLHTSLGALLAAEPRRMLALLLASGQGRWLPELITTRRFPTAALGDDAAAQVARAVGNDSTTLEPLLAQIPPGRRERVFDSAMTGIDRATLEIPGELLSLLPRAVQHREARRMLGLRRVADSPRKTLEAWAFLPYDEAAPVLTEVTRRQNPKDRVRGYGLLIDCAGRERDPQVITRLLESLGRLRNEHDKARHQAITALAGVPARALCPEHGPYLERIAEDALQARDCSWETRESLSLLATTVCERGAALGDPVMMTVGLEILRKIAARDGELPENTLDLVPWHGDEHRPVDWLAPCLAGARHRGDHVLTVQLAEALGRRAHGVAELQRELEEAALSAPDGDVTRRVIELWLAPPRTRADRAGRLVSEDPSAATLAPVFAVIARERTDLLHLVLGGGRLAGRFWNPGVVHVPEPARAWMRRWTARQRGDYLALLHRVAGDGERPIADRAAAVRAIGEVPGVGLDQLRPYLPPRQADATAVLVRRSALTAAPWIATPQDVLPLLLDEAASDDAHVAMYAASRAVRFVRPSALAQALTPVLTDGKITARKEALRILLREHVPNAINIIATAWDNPDQHRDVRAAIASALRPHLHHPTAERILTEAARAEPGIASAVLGAQPFEIEEPARYAALVLRVAGSEDIETREQALTALPAWAPWSPAIAPFLAGLVTDLEETASWRTALSALVACARQGIGVEALVDAAERLAASPARDNAGAERDLPSYQRLKALAEQLSWDRDSAAVRAFSGRLPEPLDAWLTAATLRWDDGAATVLDGLADRPLGYPALDWVAGTQGAGRWSESSLPAPEVVLPHATRLAARGDLGGGLFACVLTELHGRRAGWDREWRELLRALRAHPNPDVAYRARTVLTASE